MKHAAAIQARPRILVIEDEEEQFQTYRRALPNCDLVQATTLSGALAFLRSAAPDLILLDHILADGQRGADHLIEIRSTAAHVPVIVISGALDAEERLRALEGAFGAHYFLEKPVTLERLESTVERALAECGVGQVVAGLRSLERREKESWSDPDRRFTERLERQHELLVLLRSLKPNERPNLTEIGARFGVDRRSIRRDLEDLERRGQIRRGEFDDDHLV